jgi:hypothetical protein
MEMDFIEKREFAKVCGVIDKAHGQTFALAQEEHYTRISLLVVNELSKHYLGKYILLPHIMDYADGHIEIPFVAVGTNVIGAWAMYCALVNTAYPAFHWSVYKTFDNLETSDMKAKTLHSMEGKLRALQVTYGIMLIPYDFEPNQRAIDLIEANPLIGDLDE